ncbi:hypothetical protein [Helicobacter sp.]|uniref:hypothetical protein n=1 Tax=Helicobacter sp. TaxID=218 RepID=UPI0025BE74F1|nr:hypothetical protein [Helicobacter sp.]MBR2495533.1 hypothetical protein [Helicobacter sp.]
MLDSTRELVRASYDDLEDESTDTINEDEWEEEEQEWEDTYSQYDSDDYEDPDYEYDE